MDLLLEAENIINSARDTSAKALYAEEKKYITLGPFKDIVRKLQMENIEIKSKIQELTDEKEIPLSEYINTRLNIIIQQLNPNIIISPDINVTKDLIVKALKNYETTIRTDMLDIKEDNKHVIKKISSVGKVPEFKKINQETTLNEKIDESSNLQSELNTIQEKYEKLLSQNQLLKKEIQIMNQHIKSSKSRLKTISDVENTKSSKYNSSKSVIKNLTKSIRKVEKNIDLTKLVQRYSDSILEIPKPKLEELSQLLNEIENLQRVNQEVRNQKMVAKISTIRITQSVSNQKNTSFRYII